MHNLLGKLLLNIGDVKRAAELFVEALRLNPFMWDAFECLCSMGKVLPVVLREQLIDYTQGPGFGHPKSSNRAPKQQHILSQHT